MQNINNLYVIGNGFDIRHDIPSRYSDFAIWLLRHHSMDALSLSYMFDEENKLWSNFEEALGCYDPLKAIDGFFTPMAAESITNDFSPVETSTIYALSYDEIANLFCEWIGSIDLSKTIKKLQLDPNSTYLTFNYTKTLEVVYQVNPKQIFHIHGIVDIPDSIIFGHDKYIDIESVIGDPQSSRSWITQANRLFEMNLLYKDVDRIIRNSPYFERLTGFDTITVLGHSLNKVDKRYFDKLISQNPDANWIIDYNPKWPIEFDIKKEFLKNLGVHNIIPFNDGSLGK